MFELGVSLALLFAGKPTVWMTSDDEFYRLFVRIPMNYTAWVQESWNMVYWDDVTKVLVGTGGFRVIRVPKKTRPCRAFYRVGWAYQPRVN